MAVIFQARAITGFRPLLLFWSVAAGLMIGGVIGLQFMGPITPATSWPGSALAPLIKAEGRPAPAGKPAQATASDPNPAPLPRLTASSIPDPDPAMLEPAVTLPDRMLPIMAGPGRAPSQVYAAAFDPAERHPRVALVIDGAGLDRALTAQAIATLPSTIDLAFSAYAPPEAASALASQARRLGRECLVSIPMEPSGYPYAEEGNRALTVGAAPAENRQSLEWALSSVAGCAGATGGSDGLGGERFAESIVAFGDMLSVLERRGLIYLDPRPRAGSIIHRLPGHAPLVVDTIVNSRADPDEPADAQAIDRNLAALAQIAAHHGSAIGLAGPPTPVLLDRVAVWAHGLAAQGIVLAPLTAMPPARTPAEETQP